MQQISGPIFEDKVIDFILEMAKVSDVVIEKDVLYQTEDGDAMPVKKVAKKSAKKAEGKKLAAKKAVTKKASQKKAAAKKPAKK